MLLCLGSLLLLDLLLVLLLQLEEGVRTEVTSSTEVLHIPRLLLLLWSKDRRAKEGTLRSVKGPAKAVVLSAAPSTVLRSAPSTVLSAAPSTVLLPEAEGASWLGEGASLAALRRGEGPQPPVLVGGLKGPLEGTPAPCLDQVDWSS